MEKKFYNEILIEEYGDNDILISIQCDWRFIEIYYFATAARNYAIIEANRKRPCLIPRVA